MKYPKLEAKKENKFTVDEFGSGIDLLREDAPIANCKNMIYSAGAIMNRPNMELTDGEIFYKEDENCINETAICNAAVFLNGKYYKAAVFSLEEPAERVIYNFYLFSEDGTALKTAPLTFARVSTAEYNRPESITVFSATRKFGCGVYALVSVHNSLAQKKEEAYSLKMFELGNDLEEWISIGPDDMYIPEYMVDGRGNLYSQGGMTLPEPSYKEPINMLNNSFKCTYTSDGLSPWFELPPGLIKEGYLEYFNCKVYLEEDEVLSFTVNPATNTSHTVTYNGEKIYATFVPSSGFLRFKNFIPPLVADKDNNIVVTVRIKSPENDIKFASMDKSIWYSSREAGAYLCLAGNKYHPSRICVSAKDNPLYFPDGNSYLVGDPSQKITGLARQNKDLVIFKEKEIYCADCASNKFSVTHLHASIGCDLPSTIALCENRLVWANSDNKVYTLNALSDYGAVAVYNMSRSIDWELAEEDFSCATGCYCNRQYFLFLRNRVYVLDLSGTLLQTNREFVTASAWFYWELPEAVLVSAAYSGKNFVNMLCSIKDNNSYYIALLCGSDGIDKYFDTSLTIQKRVSESTLTTGLLYDDNYYNKKLFTKLFMGVFAERDVFIDFMNEMGDTVKNAVINIKYNGKKTLYSYRILPLVRCLGVSVKLRAYGNIKLNKLTFMYKETV